MTNFDARVRFGFSPTMLFPESFEDTLVHFKAIDVACSYPGYETFETYLPEDKAMREALIRKMKATEKVLNYNTPGILQLDGPYNPCSDDVAIRQQALNFAKMHVDFAAEAGSPLFVVTGCVDKGEEMRPELLKRHMEYFLQVAEYCKKFNITTVVEPIERHRFKKLILGPTRDCAAFIAEAQKNGADNAHLMMDIAHLPLMEETLEEAIAASLPVGLVHVHMGDAVLDPTSVFYGHTHPPVGVQKGTFDLPELTDQFVQLFECGFIPREAGGERASISLEVRPYPGVSEETSIRFMYEKMKSACDAAAAKLGIY